MNGFLKFCVENILGSLKVKTNLTRGRTITIEEFNLVDDGERAVWSLKENAGVICKFDIVAEYTEDSALFSIETDTSGGTPQYYGFTSDNAVNIEMGGERQPDNILAFYHQYTCWIQPQMTDRFDHLGDRTQNFFAKFDSAHFHVLGLCGENFRCEFDRTGLHLSIGTTGIRDLKGPFMSVSVAEDPFTAVKQNYEYARSVGAITVPLKREKKLSYIFDGLGWCTWDAFEQNVSEELIMEKLRELKEKNVPIHWVLIDDGWFIHEGETLKSFKADPKKFPNGIEGTVSRIKQEFGVEFVGIWHAFEGYWYGIVEGSELFLEQEENLVKTPTRFYIPSLEVEKGYAFWDTWHSYLEESGIDFLKVDNQSSYSLMTEGMMPTAEACRRAHGAFERSASEHFNGAVINCMGMDMENNFARTTSVLSRSGEDFGCVEDLRGIKNLMFQNVYNTLWHDQMYYSDYDMWWSGRMYPHLTATLRAISGGPIYISDGIGETEPEILKKIAEDDGTIMYCDHGAYPTSDCVYGIRDGALKIWNRSGEAFAAAVFNMGDEKLKAELALETIHGIEEGRDYIAYEYFTKKYTRVRFDGKLSIEIAPDQVAAYSIYPIYLWDDEEYIMQGDEEKIFPIASKHKYTVSVVDIDCE